MSMNTTRRINIGACMNICELRRVLARGLQESAGNLRLCRPGPLTGRVFKQHRRKSPDGFTLVELVVVLAVIAVLAMLLLPAIAATKPGSQAFQCQNNQKQITLAWQMYAEDNRDVLPPNDFPYNTAYATYPNKSWMKNWVVGTMEQPFDTVNNRELADPNTLLSAYVTNAAVYRCPADTYIDPFSHGMHVRSYSMNSAIGTIWYTFYTGGMPALGSPVQGGWLSGGDYNQNQTTWLTYGKMSSFTRPGPANIFLIMDEHPYSINDGTFEASAMATPGNTYLIAYPAGNHDGGSCISFADGHAITHKWLDSRTSYPEGANNQTHQSPDDTDCFYLAPITSAPR
jgi:prepilin-type N-terminal cleavage/methylation domain-containing protein